MACSKVSRRLPFFDNLKGVLIALVVVGHFFNGALSAQIVPAWCLFDFIYSFHMPLFIFVSGMFCKSAYSQKKGFRAGLVLYYLLLSWMMYLALWLPQAFLGVAEPLNLLTLDGSMPWYLMALAVYCALTPLFSALKPSFAIVAACGLAVLSGFVDVGNVFSASRVIVFSPFFFDWLLSAIRFCCGFYQRLSEKSSYGQSTGRRLTCRGVGCFSVVRSGATENESIDFPGKRLLFACDGLS